jgi:hypothetical protein
MCAPRPPLTVSAPKRRENDTLSRRYVTNRARLKPNRAPHIVVYLLGLKLNIAPKLVAISAVIEIDVPYPEDSDTEN